MMIPKGFYTFGCATATHLFGPGRPKPGQDVRLVVIQALTQNVRWRDDGTPPTASSGMQLAAGSSMSYTGDFSKIQFIEETGTAVLNISCYTVQ